MSNSFIQIWFSYACQQMTGIADSCLFLTDESKESFLLAETTSEAFSQSKYVHESIQAVLSRRKAVVTQQVSNQQAGSSATAAATVTDINNKNFLVTAPLILNKQLAGIVCFEFKHAARSRPQSQSPNYLESVEASIAWLSCFSQLPTASGSKDAESVLKVIVMALSQDKSSEASMAVASELAGRLQCERVSIGLVENNDVRLHTISNSTQHVTRQNLVSV